MNWEEALADIESSEFDTNVNVVSGLRAFFRAVDKEPSVREARRLLMESGEAREDALGRIFEFSVAEVDLQYENPHDTPLAVLLWLTYYTAPALSKVAAHYAMNAPKCWYAYKLARNITTPRPVDSENSRIDFGVRDWSTANIAATSHSVNMVDASIRFRILSRASLSPSLSENQEHYAREMS